MRRVYEAWRPSGDARETVGQANAIVAEYRGQGYQLTLRQLYYQFVARGFIPNNMRSYKRLGEVVNRGRLAGLIDWSAIEDRTRNLAGGDGHTWEPEDLIRAYARSYDVTRWDGQSTAVEIWVEKEALAGVVERAATRWRVPYFSCRGYVSQSELWGAARRLEEHLQEGRQVLVLHLGDHDPSGIDMTRDMRDRLETFIGTDWLHDSMPERSASRAQINANIEDHLSAFLGDEVPPLDRYMGFELRRIALNSDQVEEYNPPPNPTKLTDSRANGYIDRFGHESWELDALDPATLVALIDSHIEPVVDQDLWDARGAIEDERRGQFAAVADNWSEILEQYV